MMESSELKVQKVADMLTKATTFWFLFFDSLPYKTCILSELLRKGSKVVCRKINLLTFKMYWNAKYFKGYKNYNYCLKISSLPRGAVRPSAMKMLLLKGKNQQILKKLLVCKSRKNLNLCSYIRLAIWKRGALTNMSAKNASFFLRTAL